MTLNIYKFSFAKEWIHRMEMEVLLPKNYFAECMYINSTDGDESASFKDLFCRIPLDQIFKVIFIGFLVCALLFIRLKDHLSLFRSSVKSCLFPPRHMYRKHSFFLLYDQYFLRHGLGLQCCH